MLTAREKNLLNRTEIDRIARACEKHNDVVRLIRDLRAIRSLRQKNQDKANRVVRDKKAGNLALNTRYRDKQKVFDKVVKSLEARLEKLRDAAAAECPTRRTASRTSQAAGLLGRALPEIEGGARSLRESHSIDGKLVDQYGVVEEVARLESLGKDIRTFLNK